jgi:hypothetical protein
MSIAMRFASHLPDGSELQELWMEVQPYFNQGEVASREQAYILFSRVLKITQEAVELDDVRDVWLDLLSQGCFSLKQENNPLQNYDFSTLVELVKSGRKNFDVTFLEVDPLNCASAEIASAIDSIALSSLGHTPGVNFFKRIILSPSTFCLLAHDRQSFMACTYGTYVELASLNLFHLNFLGRKIEYPAIQMIEKLLMEKQRVLDRFPNIHYFTLCVQVSNTRMDQLYRALGFKEISYVENGTIGEPVYFLGMKRDPNSTVEPPSYPEFRAAYDRLRSKEG